MTGAKGILTIDSFTKLTNFSKFSSPIVSDAHAGADSDAHADSDADTFIGALKDAPFVTRLFLRPTSLKA